MAFTTNDTGADAFKRAIGCLFITQLPAKGLDEALESLRDLWEYHAPRPVQVLPRMMSNTVQGRIGTVGERAPLVLDEP